MESHCLGTPGSRYTRFFSCPKSSAAGKGSETKERRSLLDTHLPSPGLWVWEGVSPSSKSPARNAYTQGCCFPIWGSGLGENPPCGVSVPILLPGWSYAVSVPLPCWGAQRTLLSPRLLTGTEVAVEECLVWVWTSLNNVCLEATSNLFNRGNHHAVGHGLAQDHWGNFFGAKVGTYILLLSSPWFSTLNWLYLFYS